VKNLLLAILMIMAFPHLLWGQYPLPKSEPDVALVFSSTVQGEVEPCG